MSVTRRTLLAAGSGGLLISQARAASTPGQQAENAPQ
ncbi:ABC transporter substrate-binding protein, partial [Mesorhizobium sp. M7A.T.Ca.TU.009.01.3.1]